MLSVTEGVLRSEFGSGGGMKGGAGGLPASPQPAPCLWDFHSSQPPKLFSDKLSTTSQCNYLSINSSINVSIQIGPGLGNFNQLPDFQPFSTDPYIKIVEAVGLTRFLNKPESSRNDAPVVEFH